MASRNGIVAFCLLLLYCLVTSSLAAIACTGSDCIIYDISTQSSCTEVISEAPTRDCRWYAGLQSNVDQIVKGGRIVAYKIQWFNGAWSAWYFYSPNIISLGYSMLYYICYFIIIVIRI